MIFFIKKNDNNNNENENEKTKHEGDKEENCLTYNKTTNECSSSNIRYKLIDGKCILNYSFKAIYYTKEKNENIKLIITPLNNIIY